MSATSAGIVWSADFTAAGTASPATRGGARSRPRRVPSRCPRPPDARMLKRSADSLSTGPTQPLARFGRHPLRSTPQPGVVGQNGRGVRERGRHGRGRGPGTRPPPRARPDHRPRADAAPGRRGRHRLRRTRDDLHARAADRLATSRPGRLRRRRRFRTPATPSRRSFDRRNMDQRATDRWVRSGGSPLQSINALLSYGQPSPPSVRRLFGRSGRPRHRRFPPSPSVEARVARPKVARSRRWGR